MTDSTNVDASNPEGRADPDAVAAPQTQGNGTHEPDKHEDEALVAPGSTATGGGTSEAGSAEIGTTEGDVSDGSEQKLPPVDPPA